MKLNKKAKSELIALIFVLLILILGIIFFLCIKDKMDEFRRTPEGICLKEIATEFCESKGMTFKKLYTDWYDSDFACNGRGNTKEYDFTRDEKKECGIK